jgi:DNA polymerase III alpha subunit
MQTLKEKFVAGAYANNKVSEPVAERIWELMAAFAGYGFPKAHAASYAVIGWRAAWCKTHYPAIFMAAVLANWGGYYSQRVYLSEARRMGLNIRPPHVNYAQRQYSVQPINGKQILFMGLEQVRELTHRTQARILHQRPFYSLDDFLARADPRPTEAENLTKVGALSGFGPIPALLHYIRAGAWGGRQLPLFPFVNKNDSDWDLAQRITAQEALLGVGVDAHPLELVTRQISASGATTTLDAATRTGQSILVVGMRQTWRRRIAHRGDYIYFMTLEDLEGTLNILISAETYRRSRTALSNPGPYIVEGVIELDKAQKEPYLRAERIENLTMDTLNKQSLT